MRPRVPVAAVCMLVLLFGSVVGLQAVRVRYPLTPVVQAADDNVPAIRSAAFVERAALSYDALAADVYWMRVVQQYGRTKLSDATNKSYDFLYPLLDITTSLDPDFEVAYRFGAIFLAENYPGGAGRPDLAIVLLEKGLRRQPTKWQYAQDIAFVHYWWRRDYTAAADWFRRAARLPASPNWLAPMAAVTLTQGGDRAAARRLWTQVLNNTDADWLIDQARFRLLQLDALDQIESLQSLVDTYGSRTGTPAGAWTDLIRAGLLAGEPLDPHRFPYALEPYSGAVALAKNSTLAPLPTAGSGPR